jgi:hypothetical protein
MSSRNRRLRSAVAHCALGAAATGLLAFAPPAAFAADPTQAELMQQIEALRAKVEQLESHQNATAQRLDSREVDATIDGVLRDADRRSQFMQAQGFTAGYNKGKFLIQSEDGNFVLNPGVQFQFRYVANLREESSTTSGTPPVTDQDPDNVESGFEVRRLKFTLAGNLFAPDVAYDFTWATSRSSGGLTLENAWVRLGGQRLFGDGMKDFAFKFGQFKDFTFHEEITSSKRQLAVDRSMMNEMLAGGITDYVQGASLLWDDGAEGLPLRAEIAYLDGLNSDNTNFFDLGGSSFYDVSSPDYGASGRLEYLAFGNWKAYDDFTTLGNAEDTLVIGAGAHFSEAGNASTLLHTVDAQYEMGPLGLYAAYVGAATDNDNASGGNWYDYGFLGQAGYMLTDKWEVFGRYDYVSLDSDRSDAENEFHEVTAGVNYYMEKHAMKFTADVTYLPNGTPLSGSTADGIGHLGDDADEDQFVFRAQFQLLL